MKIYYIIFITIGLIFVAIKLCAQKADGSLIVFPESFNKSQSALIIENISELPKNTQLSISFLNNDKVSKLGILNDNWTLKNIDNQDSIFEIGSITKVLTSQLLADAVLTKKVNLDTDITALLGYELLTDDKITLQQLSNHTSGLMMMPGNVLFSQMKEPDSPYKHYDGKMLKTWLTGYMTRDLDQTKSVYSNLGAALLAHGLCKKMGKSYEELLQSKIFEPLSMTSSTSQLDKVSANLVKGQNQAGQPTANWEFDALAGAGAVLSSNNDLVKYAKALISKEVPAMELQKQPTFTVSENMDMGLGWHIFNGKGGNTYYWHNGGTNGYTSSMLVDVDRKLGFIVLSNLSAFHPKMENIDNLVFELMKTMN